MVAFAAQQKQTWKCRQLFSNLIPVQSNVNIEICIYSTNNPIRIRSIHQSETLLIKLPSLSSIGHGPTSWQEKSFSPCIVLQWTETDSVEYPSILKICLPVQFQWQHMLNHKKWWDSSSGIGWTCEMSSRLEVKMPLQDCGPHQDWDPTCKVWSFLLFCFGNWIMTNLFGQIYIGGLRSDSDKYDVEEAFGQYGKVLP